MLRPSTLPLLATLALNCCNPAPTNDDIQQTTTEMKAQLDATQSREDAAKIWLEICSGFRSKWVETGHCDQALLNKIEVHAETLPNTTIDYDGPIDWHCPCNPEMERTMRPTNFDTSTLPGFSTSDGGAWGELRRKFDNPRAE